jgi:signal peptidase II
VNDAVETSVPIQPPYRPSSRTEGRQWWVLFLVGAIAFSADQVTKHLVRTRLPIGDTWPSSDWWVHFEHATNTGAAFSILQNQSAFLVFTSLIGLGAIVLYFVYPPFNHPVLRVAFGMQLGGAIGNLLDRVRLGSVTDFIKFPHYPTFNVADSCIVVGVCILAWFLLFHDGEDQRTKRA